MGFDRPVVVANLLLRGLGDEPGIGVAALAEAQDRIGEIVILADGCQRRF
jgi:hypothetical protein